jgi:hypothetical protein
MDPITIALVAAKIIGGIVGNRSAKRQARDQALRASIGSNFARSNLLKTATAGLGSTLAAANRSGGFSSLSGGWNNLAADLRQIDYNQISQNQQALAAAFGGRMSLLNASVGAVTTLASARLKPRLTGSPSTPPPVPYPSKFLDQDWLGQTFGRGR